MIQYIWILLLLGSSYVYSQLDIIPSVLSNVTKTATTTAAAAATATATTKKTITALSVPTIVALNGYTTADEVTSYSAATQNGNANDARNTRELRLLEGETMGDLEDCDSFEIGDMSKKEFYSPNYPNEYPAKKTCTRRLTADFRDERVVVDFRDRFDLEPSEGCKYDRLEVRDGAHGYSPERGIFCGHQFPEKITSTGSNLWLRFSSDDNIEYKGFRAVYWFEKRNISEEELNEQSCVINKTESNSDFNLSHTDIPEDVRLKANKSGLDCMFNIFVHAGKSVSLSWDEFLLQYPNDCELNYVNILDEGADTIKQKFCGAAAEPIQFTGNEVQIQFVLQKSAINSSFQAHFTPFRKSTNCSEEEFDCQDGSCIARSLKCNHVNNCVTASDEDAEECKQEESFIEQLSKIDLLIILIVFFVILFGMCFTLIFNIARKLIHDFSVIKEHVHQSRESQLDQLGRKTPTATLLTPMVTVLPNLPDNLLTPKDIRASIHADHEDIDDCYVPTEHTFPNIVRKDFGFDRMNGGPQYLPCQVRGCDTTRDYRVEEEEDGLATHSGSYMPEMRDNECQTRESLFYNTSSSTGGDSSGLPKHTTPSPPSPAIFTIRGVSNAISATKPAANALPSVAIPPPIGFTTFGYTNNQKPNDNSKTLTRNANATKAHRFRAEAVIEMDRFGRSPKHALAGGGGGDVDPSNGKPAADPRQSRPYSVQSTKSAPDVIVTH